MNTFAAVVDELAAEPPLAPPETPWRRPQNPFDIGTLDIFDSKLPPGSTSADGSITYLLGTDGQARDLLSAIFYGLRTSLLVSVISVVASLAIGSLVGLAAAYFELVSEAVEAKGG